MGWERKRGKLHELNRLLRGATDTTFIGIDGHPPRRRRTSATSSRSTPTRGCRAMRSRRLVGKMAHPLNRPRFDPASGRVVEGYGILQPRVTPSLPVGARRLAVPARLLRARSGIDPYAAAVSDVYQDLFGEGSYTGKGIYDVDAFEAALEGRCPTTRCSATISSKGMFARAGLVTDIEVVEEFPARYDVARAPASLGARRLAAAAVDAGARAGGRATRAERLPAGDRPLEDVRQPAAHAVARRPRRWRCWRAGPLPLSAALVWTRFVLLDRRVAAFLPVIAAHRATPCRRSRLRSHLGALAADVSAGACAVGSARGLPGRSGLADGATRSCRTLFRLFVSRRHLLEWTTAAQSKSGRAPTGCGFYRRDGGRPRSSRRWRALVVWHVGRRRWPLAAALRRCSGSRRRRSRAGSAWRRSMPASLRDLRRPMREHCG